MKARVTIYPRDEILDPQGKAIHQALDRLGFEGVAEVRAGKTYAIELATRSRKTAEKQLVEMCERLLANKVMERYEIELPESGS